MDIDMRFIPTNLIITPGKTLLATRNVLLLIDEPIYSIKTISPRTYKFPPLAHLTDEDVGQRSHLRILRCWKINVLLTRFMYISACTKKFFCLVFWKLLIIIGLFRASSLFHFVITVIGWEWTKERPCFFRTQCHQLIF